MRSSRNSRQDVSGSYWPMIHVPYSRTISSFAGWRSLAGVEGQNIVFDCVSPVGRIDQVPTLARELVSRRPDVLIAGAYPNVSALKQETTTIPIVMLATWEPARLGFVTS
jgi:ABC-type uncharacterized transport system substrate-binding protein